MEIANSIYVGIDTKTGKKKEINWYDMIHIENKFMVDYLKQKIVKIFDNKSFSIFKICNMLSQLLHYYTVSNENYTNAIELCDMTFKSIFLFSILQNKIRFLIYRINDIETFTNSITYAFIFKKSGSIMKSSTQFIVTSIENNAGPLIILTTLPIDSIVSKEYLDNINESESEYEYSDNEI